MARLRKSRSNYDISLIPSDAPTRPIGLMLQRPVKNGAQGPSRHAVDYLPASAFDEKSWFWQNGPAGAGWSIETPESGAGGGLSHGENVWLRKDGSATAAGKVTEVTLPLPLNTTTGGRIFDAFEWDSAQDMYLTTGTQYMLRIPSGTGNPELRDLGSGITTKNVAIFDGAGSARAYVSCEGSAPIQEFNGTTWTAAEAAVERSRLATVYWVLGNGIATGGLAGQGGTGGYELIGTNSTGTGFYHVRGDPKVEASWSAFTKVGDQNFTIQNIVASNRVVWFGKTNGVHGVDELGYSPNQSKWFELAFDLNNCGSITYWNGAIWAAHQQGLVMIPTSGERQDVAMFVQFGYQKSNLSPIYGRPRWVAPSPEGLYVAYYNSVTNTSYIGTLQMLPSGRLRWSMAECVLPGVEVTFIRHASPGGVPRLWIGALDASDLLHLYWQDLPRTGDPELDHETGTGFLAATDWSVTGSKFNGGTADEKTFRRYTLESENVGDANTVQWLVSADGGAFSEQGVATSSPSWSGTPTTSYIRSVSAQIKLVAHNSETEPIVIRSAEVKYTPHPRLTKVKTYPVVFGENVPLKNGRPDNRDPGVTLTRLENLQTDDPMSMVDELGRTVEVLVEPGFQETMVEEADGNGYRVEGTLRVSITRQPAQFDIDVFDTGAVFA